MSASLPQSIALAGLLWLLLLAATAAVLALRRSGLPMTRAALVPAVSSIAAVTLIAWAGHALAGTRGIAVGVMMLLFAVLALFARLHASDRSRAGGAGGSPRQPLRSLGLPRSVRLPLARGQSSR